jgi:mannosyltransferase
VTPDDAAAIKAAADARAADPGKAMAGRALAIALALLAWALRLYQLGAQSFWYDEGYTVYLAELPPAESLRWAARDVTPPLYYWVQSLWLDVAGWTEFGARFPSVCAGTLMIVGIVSLGRTLRSRSAGVLAGFLAALSSFYVWHSQDARMYVSQALVGVLATLVLVRALRFPQTTRLWVAFALLEIVALYLHTMAGFLLVFHGLAVLTAGARSPNRTLLWGSGGLALGSAVLAWLPWVVYAFPFLGQNTTYWPGRLGWQIVMWGAIRGFVAGHVPAGNAERAALALWGATSLAGVLTLVCRRTRRHWGRAVLLLAYFAVPAALMAVLFRTVPKFTPRYLILASPPVFLLPGIALSALFEGRGRWPAARHAVGGLALVAMTGTVVVGLSNLYFNPALARSDFRTAARLIRAHMTPDEVVVLVPGHVFPVWQFYFGPEGWRSLPDDPYLNVAHTLDYRNAVEWLNRQLADRSGVWLVQWDPRVVDPTDVVPYLLEQVGEPVSLPAQPAQVRLLHYRLHPDRLPFPPDPAVPAPLHSSFDLPLRLIGCSLPEQVRGDEEVYSSCFWEASGGLPDYLSVSARLVDAAGMEWGRADTAITGPDLMAGAWPLSEPILGHYAVQPTPGIPPGGFYRLELVVYQLGGPAHGSASVGPVTVGRPATPFRVILPTDHSRAAVLGGLLLEAADVRPEAVRPGEEVLVEAAWRVIGPFREPFLMVAGSSEQVPLLPEPGASAAWELGDRYCTVSRVTVPVRVSGGPTSIRAVTEDGTIVLGVVQVDVRRTFGLPGGAEPTNYGLGDAISLAGTQFSVQEGDDGRSVRAVLYWRAETSVDVDYTVFVHLVGPGGQIYAQADGWPQAGRHPTSHWLPGEVVADTYELWQPTGGPAGEYRVLVGMYDLATLRRLPVTDPAGGRLPDDAIPVGSFEVP